jgi:long-subunit acyl-CoA synthetase (AMP-forming)
LGFEPPPLKACRDVEPLKNSDEVLRAMDLTKLVTRLPERHTNSIHFYENGRAAHRTHAEVYADVNAAAAALAGWGVKAGMRVGIRAPNSYRWIVYDLAIIELRAVSVAFTDDFAAAAAEELRDKYGLSLLLVASSERTRQPPSADFVAYLEGENANVRVARRDGPTGEGHPPGAHSNNGNSGGASSGGEHTGDADSDALNTVGGSSGSGKFDSPWHIFSSGSAGGLKGLVVNRKGVEAWVDAFTQAVAPRSDDRLLIFLPLSNFQQRPMYYAALWYGFDLIVTEPARLFLTLKDLKPTMLVAPPALFEAFETRFYNLPKWKRAAARAGGVAARLLPARAARERAAQLVFKQAHEALGGRMRLMITGMAPIKRATLDLFGLMQLPLFETYGLVECGSVALNVPGASRVGSVARPLPGVRVELAEDGEIIVWREHMTAVRYFECAAGENEATFIGDNRVASGDIGRLDEDGYLYLVGRKKEIIVTAGGEKVHPEVIESEIDACPDVAKSVVVKSPDAPALVAIVLPKDPRDDGARGRIEQHVFRNGGGGHRRASMSVAKIVFTPLVFTRENGLLRPNLKLDRKRIAEHFRADIAGLGA